MDRIEVKALRVMTLVGVLDPRARVATAPAGRPQPRGGPRRRGLFGRAGGHRALRPRHRARRGGDARIEGRAARALGPSHRRGRAPDRPRRGRRGHVDEAAPTDRRGRRVHRGTHPARAAPISRCRCASTTRRSSRSAATSAIVPAILRSRFDELGGVLRRSRVYETAPVGGPHNQGPYLNMVVVVETPLDPFAFIRRCQRIEALAGRQRIVHWGPRTLDVDMLFYDDARIQSRRARRAASAHRRAPLRACSRCRRSRRNVARRLGTSRCRPGRSAAGRLAVS